MNEAIKLAIQHGLKVKWDEFSQSFYFWNVGDMSKAEIENIVLWPSFWQALGKALGWGEFIGMDRKLGYVWLNEAHKYFDLALTGGDTEQFWQDLIK